MARKTGCRVLLVEDNLDLREMLELRFQFAGFDVVAAGDGEEALRLLETEDISAPEVIVTDWRMPTIDGIGLARAVRGSAHHAAVPIILFTAHPEPMTTELADLGVHYLAKNTEWEEVQATIDAVIQRG